MAWLSLKQKIIVAGGFALSLYGAWLTLSEVQRVLALAGAVIVIGYSLSEIAEGDSASSGREGYGVSWLSSKVASTTSSRSDDPDKIPVDRVDKRGDNSPRTPQIDLDTSMIFLGQTGQGKSTTIKSIVDRWDIAGRGLIVHALSEGDGNEFVRFLDDRMHHDTATMYILSSQDSSHRWNPFDDFSQSMQDMRSISDGIWTSRNTVETGWSDSARAMLTAALAVTSARHGDFARLPDVLSEDPTEIVEACSKLPDGQIITSPLQSMSDSDLGTAHSNLMTEIQPLLLSEIFDDDLPTFSLTDYMDEPLGYVVLDNIRADSFARPFWRFFLQEAIDVSMEHRQRQYFLLDEFDKLPHIDNLDELASAGRSPDSIGILAAQDAYQLDSVYPDLGRSIHSNCPNRFLFAPGDEATAELALTSIGKDEMTATTVSESSGVRDGISPDQGLSKSRTEQYPMTPRELTDLDKGECLIHTDAGWWISKITEPELEVTNT